MQTSEKCLHAFVGWHQNDKLTIFYAFEYVSNKRMTETENKATNAIKIIFSMQNTVVFSDEIFAAHKSFALQVTAFIKS